MEKESATNNSGKTDCPAIAIRDLRVDYGKFVAVEDLTLNIPRGEVFGLVGPNGAGKTSTFRVLTTLMEPTYGEVALEGLDIFENIEAVRRMIGYMPDLAPVPSDLKIGEFLLFHAAAHGLGTRAQQLERVSQCLEEVSLADLRNRWCRELSRGQTQRLVLAKTMLHRPAILILDEPASGLDPLARRELRGTLRRLAEAGATIFISSHILSELAEMCTSLCVMNHGRLLASGTADEVRAQLGSTRRVLTVSTLHRHEEAREWIADQNGVMDLQGSSEKISFGFEGTEEAQAALLTGLIAQGIPVRSFEEKRSSFEDILVEISAASRTS